MSKLIDRIKIIIVHLAYIYFIPIWVLQKLIPRKENIWIFGAWHGFKFSDNSKAFFLRVVEKHPEIQPIWITRDDNVVNELRSKGFKSYKTNSFQGIFKSLVAKVVIISNSKTDVNPFFINGAKLIQIWHGAPMKKIGMSANISLKRKLLLNIQKHLFPFLYEYTYDFVVSTSACFDEILSKAFLVPIPNIIKSGYPRNDVFFTVNQEDIVLSWNHKFNNPKKIIYLPTFRSTRENTDFFKEYEYDERKLIKVLEKHNAIFITKGHFCNNQISSSSKSERIINLSDSDIKEINPILKDIDVLLTDYSGVYFDFLLTLKPIIFTAFDLDAYKESRGINFDYNTLVSGPIAKDWKDVIHHLQNFLVEDEYLSIAKEKNKYFNNYSDGHSSSKLYTEIIKRLS